MHTFFKSILPLCALSGALAVSLNVQAASADTTDTTEISTGERTGARTVPHYTFSGTPGEIGTGSNGDTWDGTYYYLPDGVLATECFFCDGVNTYYLQNDGTSMKDRLTYHPDGEHIIYFDPRGHETFNESRTVCKSITGEDINKEYYFDVYGFMYIDQLTFLSGDSNNPSYFDYAGARVKDGQYSLPDGDLVIADKYGRLINNEFTYDAFGRIVYCNWNGTFAKGTLSDNNYFYVFDEEDGHLLNYYPTETCESGAVPFASLLFYLDEMGINKGACYYEMRLIGNNDITNSMTDWYGSENVMDYMNNIDDEYWKLSIYKDDNGNIVNDVTGTSGSYATIRGITIGSDKSVVRNAYGIPQYSGENWDWYSVCWNHNDKYAVSWKESYAIVHYGIRFYYDDNGIVNKMVYQRYPMLEGYVNNVPIMQDVQDITPYYARREIIRVDAEKGKTVEVDASVSKYATGDCTYQWYAVEPTKVAIHNGDDVEKIEGANGSSFAFDVEKYPDGVYCRVTTSDNIPYHVFFLKK